MVCNNQLEQCESFQKYTLIYTTFAFNVFSYLKKTILSDFPHISLNLIYDKDENIYAQNKFTSVNLYVYSLQQLDYTNITYMKNMILFMLIHEAMHQHQSIDYARYAQDEKYKKMIECNADFSTAIFIKNNKQELEDMFCMDIYSHSESGIIKNYNMIAGINLLRNNNNQVYVYLSQILNKFIQISDNEVYNIFINNGTIKFHFINDDESKLDHVTVREDFVMDYDKMNNIINNYLYDGYYLRLKKVMISRQKSGTLIFHIFLNENVNIPIMMRK